PPYSRGSDAPRRAADPENRLLGRMASRRLSVEAWRDAVLSTAGRLDRTVGGPSLDPQDPRERRRTGYSNVSRLELNRLFALFDFPDPNTHADPPAPAPPPLQKLFVLNSPFLVEQAAALADRLAAEEPGAADRPRIDRAYRLLYGRPPVSEEVRLGLAFLGGAGDRPARWREYAHVLLAA